MVKKKSNKKNIGGHHNPFSKCRIRKACPQTESSQDLIPLDKAADCDIPAISLKLQIHSQGQFGFPDKVYLMASVIFQNNHQEKPITQRVVNYGKQRKLSLPEVQDEEMLHNAYELAFNTLKYQELLEDIMIDSSFYFSQSMSLSLPDDQMSLVAVMLYDFQDRKFIFKSEVKDKAVQQVKDSLLRYKVKLAASLARYKIRHQIYSIDCILPESVKTKQERARSLPLYAWVNTLKSSLDQVQSVLKSSGFTRVKSIGQLEGQTFCQDPHCEDVLVFPAQQKAELYSTKLIADRSLIIQDKSCSLGPHAVCSVLPEEGDLLMLGCFSGLTVCHTAALIADKHKVNGTVRPTVYVCVSGHTSAQRKALQQAVTAMGCKNVKLIPEVFQSLDGDDERLQKLRVILLTPKCSLSAVSNPVNFIMQENADSELLQDLSQSAIAPSKLEALVAQQRKDIDHALKFSKVVAVVYSTCSSYLEENEEVVNRALEQAMACSQHKWKTKEAKFRPSQLSITDHAEGPEEVDNFFMLQPSEQSNGCFLAVLTREPEPVIKEAPQQVIGRANAKGILDRIGSKKEQQGHTNRMTKTTHFAHTSEPHISASIQSKTKDKAIKGDNSTTQQEFTKRWQSSKGKAKALCLQASTKAVSSSLSSLKPENITPVDNTTTSMPPTPASTPETPVARLHRAHRELLKLAVTDLPATDFPNFFPPQPRQIRFSPSFNYKSPAQNVPLSSYGLSKDTVVKSRPLF